MNPAAILASSRLQARLRQSICLLIWLACLSLAQPFAAMAQMHEPAPLPPAAQEAFDKGIMAAREQGYLVAIRYLQEARKLAPQAPIIYLNMGLAESKIPGRELRAIAWFSAYLAAYPDAPNAAAVKNEIARLELKTEITISGLIKAVQDAARQKSSYGDSQLYDVARLWIDSGDIAAALKTVSLFTDPNTTGRFSMKGQTLVSIAFAQVKTGDIPSAQRTADLFQSDSVIEKSEVRLHIVAAQTNDGDIAGAQKTAALIEVPSYQIAAQSAIAEALAKAGDSAGAEKNFASVLKSVDLQDARQRSFVQYLIAYVQTEAGNVVGAQKTVDLIQEGYWKIQSQLAIVEAQTKNGDIAGAQKTIVEMQKSADLIQGEKGWTQEAISKGQAAVTRIRLVITVSDWLTKLDDHNKSNDCPLNTEPFLDLSGYLKSLPPSDDPQKVFESLHETAEKIVSARNIITGMLKQEIKK